MVTYTAGDLLDRITPPHAMHDMGMVGCRAQLLREASASIRRLLADREWRGYAAVALDGPKASENVGGALRAAGVYGAAMVVTSGKRYGGHPTDTMRAYKHIPLLQVADVLDAIPYDCVPVAVDILPGATPLHQYEHPERAFYIFGGEDRTLGARITDRCRDVVVVPTRRCMNLAATVNVVLYDRTAKQLAKIEREAA